MKKYLFSLLFIPLITSVTASFEKDVVNVLKPMKYDHLKLFVDSLERGNGRVDPDELYFREIIPSFNESVIYFEKSVPDKKDKSVSSVYNYRLTIIEINNEIIYYDFTQEVLRGTEEENVKEYKPIKKYKNDTRFLELQNNFIKCFGDSLQTDYLFNQKMVYGHKCGITGADPKEISLIDNWVSSNNRDSLMLWIQSGQTEMQLYAVEGFYKLKSKGTELTPVELERIKYIKNKKGTALSCSGEIYQSNEVSVLLKEFEF